MATQEIYPIPQQEFESFISEAKKCGDYMSLPLCITYDDIPAKLKYRATPTVAKKNLHMGQLKLLCSEIQFLTCETLNSFPNINSLGYVIYVGSAPGVKTSILMECFPWLKFILIDPSTHYISFGHTDQYSPNNRSKILYLSTCGYKVKCLGNKISDDSKVPRPKRLINMWDGSKVKLCTRPAESRTRVFDALNAIKSTTHQVYILEEFFTNELAQALKDCLANEGVPMYFISDIRTNTGGEDSPSDIDIIWNCAQQYNWAQILMPTSYMLKFRCPFEYDYNKIIAAYKAEQFRQNDIDVCPIPFLENARNGTFQYIAGDVRIQAFAGSASSEARLVVRNTEYDQPIRTYNVREYEDKFFYYNHVIRSHKIHNNVINYKLGVDRCADCALLLHIVAEYNNKRPKHIPVLTLERILSVIGKKLRIMGHGLLYKPISDLVEYQNGIAHLMNLRGMRGIINTPTSKMYSASEYDVICRTYGISPTWRLPSSRPHYYVCDEKFSKLLKQCTEVCVDSYYTLHQTVSMTRRYIIASVPLNVNGIALLYVPSLSPELEYCLMEMLLAKPSRYRRYNDDSACTGVVLVSLNDIYIVPHLELKANVCDMRGNISEKTLYLFGRNVDIHTLI